MCVGLLWNLDLVFLEGSLDFGDQFGDFLAQDAIVNKVGQRVEQVSILLALDLCQDHQVLRGIIETIATHGSHIVKLRFLALLGTTDLIAHLVNFLLGLLLNLLRLADLAVDLLPLIANLD